MKKTAAASIIAMAAALACLLGLVGCERNNIDNMIVNEPSAVRVDRGNISSNTGLETSCWLNKSNGQFVNLYVENNGANSVVATINGQSARTIQAGEQGYISLEVTQNLFGLDKEYEFKVVPGTNGGSISIYYEIAQDTYAYSAK